MSTVTTKNYKVRLQFARDIVERMGIDEVRHYKKRVWSKCCTSDIRVWMFGLL